MLNLRNIDPSTLDGALGLVIIRPGPGPMEAMTSHLLPGLTQTQAARVLHQLAHELELGGLADGDEIKE
jgi:hypothetical protein